MLLAVWLAVGTLPLGAQGNSLSNAAPGATVAPSASEDIRDIRGPKHIPWPWRWLFWGAGLAVLGYAGYTAWQWHRRRQRLTPKLAYEIALARLEEARALMRPENARAFSIAVSEIARNYIEERFQVWAARRTTEEFLYDLLSSSDARLTNYRPLLVDFLRHCDLAKFAGWTLSLDEMENMYRCAHTFVLETGTGESVVRGSSLTEESAATTNHELPTTNYP